MKAIKTLVYKQKHFLPFLLFLVIFIAVVFIVNQQIKNSFEYDIDEGFELIKSSLFLKGFPLYRQISSDQPPLFTVMLSNWFKLFKPTAYHGRILILFFSFALLWAFYGIVKNYRGRLCAFIAVIFLLLSSAYLRLSVSVMIGTAALSFAMVAIYFLTLYKRSRAGPCLALSGLFLGLSVVTKLFTIFILPIFILEIIRSEKRIRAVLLWLLSFSAVPLAILILFFQSHFNMLSRELFLPHFKKLVLRDSDFSIIWKMILSDYDTAILSLIGIILILKQKFRESFFPVWCLALTLLILLVHRPVWYHYYLPVSISLSWLAAIGFSELLCINLKQGWHIRKKQVGKYVFFRYAAAFLIILTILRLPGKFDRMFKAASGKTAFEERRAIELLSRYGGATRWIFTDRPIFAFYAKIPVPPELALITEKRKFTDTPSQNYLIHKLEEYKPGLILLTELGYCGPQVNSYIEKNYCRVYYSKFSSPVWFLESDVWIVKRMLIAKRIELTVREWLAYPNWIVIRDCFTDKAWLERFNALLEPTYEKEIRLYMRNDIVKSLGHGALSP